VFTFWSSVFEVADDLVSDFQLDWKLLDSIIFWTDGS